MALLCLPFSARAESSLDLQSWLDRPGVRAVVVEFYATWCEPCMKAMPRWKSLQEKFGKDGLRVLVVNTRDEDDPGKCASLGWTPDALICDTEGVIDERFGVKGKLPSAFLWSWEHKLLVQRGHVTEVEAAVEALFKALPRVEVASEGAARELVDEVTAAINYSAKMRVVASEAERERLRRMRLSQQSASVGEETRCELGKEVAANSSLVVSMGKDRAVRLKLIDLESGCVTQSSVGANPRDAVENLVGKLRVPIEWPGAGRKVGAAVVTASNDAGLATLLVTSDVEGAEVSINGRPQGVSAGRKAASFSLPPGRKQVKVSKAGYLDDLRTVEVKSGETVSVAAHLQAEATSAPTAPVAEGGATSFLTVSSEPRGAVITLDGMKVGKTPRSFEVAPGRHRVAVGLEWYVDTQAEVVVIEGASQKVELTLAPGFGEVEVTTTPAQATVFLDGRQVGTTEPTLSLSRVTPGSHRVKVTRTDFHDAELSIDVTAGKKLSVKVPALKPSVGALKVVSDPPGARAVVDGRHVGTTPVTVERLSDGPHAVKVMLDDNEEWEGSAAVVEGTERELRVALESLRGALQVNSVPAGQPVAVDGEERGNTPVRLSLLEGEHRVRVGTPGAAYSLREERVTVVRGRTQRLDWTLEALFGRLVVMTDPPEATVLLDGREVGLSPLQIPKVLIGEHTIEARLDKHESASHTVHIEAAKDARVRLELAELVRVTRATAADSMRVEPASSQPSAGLRMGTLVVTANVDGAQLLIDGVPRPDPIGTRGMALDLKAGKRSLRATKPGFLEDLQTVVIVPSQQTRLALNLTPEGGEARKRAPGEATTVLQIATSPPDAVILVDDVPMGKSPLSLSLAPGKHIVKARLEWYRESVVSVTLEPYTPLAKAIDLVADFGRLELTSASPGVAVALDDRAEGVANPSIKRAPMAPGEYRLRASLPAHHDYEETVTIKANETTRVNIPAMRSLENGGAPARLEARARPSSSEGPEVSTPLRDPQNRLQAPPDVFDETIAIDVPSTGSCAWLQWPTTRRLEWQAKPSPGRVTWQEATAYCSKLSLAGGGWRLPTLAELKQLSAVKDRLVGHRSAVGLSTGWYWSSSIHEGDRAWVVDFDSGEDLYDRHSRKNRARCVR